MPSDSDLTHRWKSGDLITAERLDSGNRLINRIILNQRRMMDRISILESRAKKKLSREISHFKINSSSDYDSTAINRWKYDLTQQYKADRGYDSSVAGETASWFDLPNGYTGIGFNYIENMNDGAGVEGHGVDVDGADYPAGFSVMPIPAGALVPGWFVTVDRTFKETKAGGEEVTVIDPTTEVWFLGYNTDDGTCI